MIVYDTETTGLPKPMGVPLNEQPQIIEFAAIKLDDKTLKEKDRIEFLIQPGVPLPPEIVKITGIQDVDLKDAKPFIHHLKTVVDFFLGERSMVAHNLGFDKALLKFELLRLDKEFAFPWPPDQWCTVEASYGIKNRRLHLSELHELATGKPHKGAHRAINDVEALCTCIRWLRKEGHI